MPIVSKTARLLSFERPWSCQIKMKSVLLKGMPSSIQKMPSQQERKAFCCGSPCCYHHVSYHMHRPIIKRLALNNEQLFLTLSHLQAQEEVDRVLGERAVPTVEDFMELKYLMRCVNESMRLYPHPPVLLRRAQVADTLPGASL